MKSPCRIIAVYILLALAFAASAKDCLVYFGTFTNELSKGIYVSRLDEKTGKLTPPGLAAEISSPNFIAASPNGKFLYAAIRMVSTNGEEMGVVSAFMINTNSGKLQLLNRQSSGGAGPCHVSVDANGKEVFVANFTSGSVKALPVKADGGLGESDMFVRHLGSSVDTNRQASAHAHCMVVDPSNRFVLACDLGMDKVLIYSTNITDATLAAQNPMCANLAPGSGARHLVFSRDGRFAYVINEMACTMTTFTWSADAARLDMVETIPLLPRSVTVQTNFTAAEVMVHPNGKFVYASVRGHDSISVFSVNPKSGKLKLVENVSARGKAPRNFAIDPTGRWLVCANRFSDSVTVFSISTRTGKLTPTKQELRVGSPVCVVFL